MRKKRRLTLPQNASNMANISAKQIDSHRLKNKDILFTMTRVIANSTYPLWIMHTLMMQSLLIFIPVGHGIRDHYLTRNL